MRDIINIKMKAIFTIFWFDLSKFPFFPAKIGFIYHIYIDAILIFIIMKKIQNSQKFWYPDWLLGKKSGLFRECKFCKKFSLPSRRKIKTYWDTHCRNCESEIV